MIVDPPNGRLPPQTPEAQRAAAADREFFLALMQSTGACKNEEPVCAGGKYDPIISPRFAENPPRYHAVNNVRLKPRSDLPVRNAILCSWRKRAVTESQTKSPVDAPS
jgi:hypothetical protein